MKRTEYFATIEEANQYYPDGVPSGVIAIVGDGSQVLVSSDNAATNTQKYYSADLTNDEIVNTMVQDSYDEGHSDGYAEGVADAEWMPIGDAIVDIPGLRDIINGTVDSIDLYWGGIYGNFSIEEILDQQTSDVVGYRFEWDDYPVSLETGGTDPETGDPITVDKTIHVIHEEYPDPDTGEYVHVGGIPANDWFSFMFDNDGVITDLYQAVYPVMRNVTLAAAAQGADYDYILSFETLASTNDHSTLCDVTEEVTANGFYPVYGMCAFNVNVEASSDITANDFLGQIVNNTITAGYSSLFISDNTPDQSILTAAFQAASSGLGVVYKASGDTLSTLPLYNPYDEETGSQSEIVYNDGNDENSYYDWMASAPISLQVGDMLGFVVGSEYNALWIAPFDGSEPFVCETAGNYTVLMTSYTDDESGEIIWDFNIVPSTQLSGDYSNITDLNEMTMPIDSGN